MNKKFLISLAPLLAIAAIVLAPAAAQASPHYYSNNVIVGTAPKSVTAWGNITLALTKPASLVGTNITCHNSAAGVIENPGGVAGGSGTGNTELFATYACVSEKNCLLGETTMVRAERLPSTLPNKGTGVGEESKSGPGWPSVLTEELAGTIRAETNGVEVNIMCVKQPEGKLEKSTKFDELGEAKGQRPKSVKGSSALHPGFLEFGAGSGELEVVGSGNTVSGKTEGEVKVLGYEEQELINTKSP
jgi:hypothetical protein